MHFYSAQDYPVMNSLDFKRLLFHIRPAYDINCTPIVKLPLIFIDRNVSNIVMWRCLSKLNLF